MEPRAGILVTPNVKLTEKLGEGGMGSVWLADHLTLDTQVAVKFMADPARLNDATVVARFKREAAIAAKTTSPHAVHIYDYGLIGDVTPFIVMELLQGESLATLLARGPLSLHDVTLLVSQVAEVLTSAHAKGIVHRDIKPGNLFLIDSGYDLFIKVLDFGIAKQTGLPAESDVTDTGAFVGTPRYISPELIESAKDATPAADLWALAVVAYEALLGVPPFAGETLGSLCIAISKAKFETPSSQRPELSSKVDAWFAKALAPALESRFDSAQAMADALRESGNPSKRATGRGVWLGVVAVFLGGAALTTYLSANGDGTPAEADVSEAQPRPFEPEPPTTAAVPASTTTSSELVTIASTEPAMPIRPPPRPTTV